MKKLISVLLCLVLMCTATCAVAERMYPMENPQTLNSVSGLASCEVPADYLILTEDIVLELVNALTAALEEENNELGLDPAAAQQMINILSNVDTSTSDYVYGPDFVSNMNIQTVSNSGLTQEILESQYEDLAASLTAQYVQLGAAEEDCVCVGLVTVGSNPTVWFQYDVKLLNSSMNQFMTCNESGDYVALTFTEMPIETTQAILESFAWAN